MEMGKYLINFLLTIPRVSGSVALIAQKRITDNILLTMQNPVPYLRPTKLES